MIRRKQLHCLFCINFSFGSFSFANLKSIELYIGLVLIKQQKKGKKKSFRDNRILHKCLTENSLSFTHFKKRKPYLQLKCTQELNGAQKVHGTRCTPAWGPSKRKTLVEINGWQATEKTFSFCSFTSRDLCPVCPFHFSTRNGGEILKYYYFITLNKGTG